ncbi:COMM domain-containing protein 6 [Apodemus speciosus]|uniref:COMM domain-containing protein 6 n=1 Tax=Apodemus speciosus TaxID=105296 RepID=A0ABQ0FIS1_APOSI
MEESRFSEPVLDAKSEVTGQATFIPRFPVETGNGCELRQLQISQVSVRGSDAKGGGSFWPSKQQVHRNDNPTISANFYRQFKEIAAVIETV